MEEDGHTFFIKCTYDKSLFVQTFEQLIQQIKEHITSGTLTLKPTERELDYSYRLNFILRDNEPAGYNYIYVKDSRIFNILLNRNPNGTSRVKYVEFATIEGEDNSMNSSDDWTQLIEDLPVLRAEPLEPLFNYEVEFTLLATMQYTPNNDEYGFLLCTKILPTNITKEDLEQYLSYYDDLQYNLHIITVKSNSNLRFAYLVCRENDKTIFYLYQMIRLFTLIKDDKSHRIGFNYVKNDNYYINRFSYIDPTRYKEEKRKRNPRRK